WAGRYPPKLVIKECAVGIAGLAVAQGCVAADFGQGPFIRPAIADEIQIFDKGDGAPIISKAASLEISGRQGVFLGTAVEIIRRIRNGTLVGGYDGGNKGIITSRCRPLERIQEVGVPHPDDIF